MQHQLPYFWMFRYLVTRGYFLMCELTCSPASGAHITRLACSVLFVLNLKFIVMGNQGISKISRLLPTVTFDLKLAPIHCIPMAMSSPVFERSSTSPRIPSVSKMRSTSAYSESTPGNITSSNRTWATGTSRASAGRSILSTCRRKVRSSMTQGSASPSPSSTRSPCTKWQLSRS